MTVKFFIEIKNSQFEFIYRGASIEAEVERIKEHQIANNNSNANFFNSLVMKPLVISLGIMFFQQTTGINAIIFYTVSIFQTAGSSIESRYATIIVGAVQLIFTVASGFLVGTRKGHF